MVLNFTFRYIIKMLKNQIKKNKTKKNKKQETNLHYSVTRNINTNTNTLTLELEYRPSVETKEVGTQTINPDFEWEYEKISDDDMDIFDLENISD